MQLLYEMNMLSANLDKPFSQPRPNSQPKLFTKVTICLSRQSSPSYTPQLNTHQPPHITRQQPLRRGFIHLLECCQGVEFGQADEFESEFT